MLTKEEEKKMIKAEEEAGPGRYEYKGGKLRKSKDPSSGSFIGQTLEAALKAYAMGPGRYLEHEENKIMAEKAGMASRQEKETERAHEFEKIKKGQEFQSGEAEKQRKFLGEAVEERKVTRELYASEIKAKLKAGKILTPDEKEFWDVYTGVKKVKPEGNEPDIKSLIHQSMSER